MGQKIYDLSYAGCKINFCGYDIDDFMDDANPVTFQEIEVSTVGVNLNGNMIRNAKPNVVMMSVTVIPGSSADNSLNALWKRYRVGNGDPSQWTQALSASVTPPSGSNLPKISLKNGTLVSGPGGPDVTNEGKGQGRTYTAAFCSVD